MKTLLAQHLNESAKTQTRFADQLGEAERLAGQIVEALRNHRKILIFGNGGSAADAQHFAAELVGRFEKDRPALAAIALTTDSSILTCVSNDYSYDVVFARQVDALAHNGDVVVALSTSGNSKNVLLAVEAARRRGAWTAGLTGETGGKLKSAVDCCVRVPSRRTAHIQECHIALIHAICGVVDEAFAVTSA